MSFNVSSYQYAIANPGASLTDGALAMIAVKSDSNDTMMFLYMPDGATLPAANSDMASFHFSQFASMVDLLRNEKPVMVMADGDTIYLATNGFEPIGEGSAGDTSANTDVMDPVAGGATE